MMRARISPSAVSGILQAPASKSAMQRACAAALIRHGRSILRNPGDSDDDLAAINIIKALGADVYEEKGKLTITSKGVRPVNNEIDCGESGLSLRMFTPVAAISDQSTTVNGHGSLLRRPIGFFEETFPSLGVQCKTSNGHLPLTVKGPLLPADITIDGSLSSQYLTGLMFAYSALNAKATITVNELASKPYIDLSLQVLSAFGLPKPVNHDHKYYVFNGSGDIRSGEIDYMVEGDWSSASFLLVAGAIGGSMKIKGLDLFSAQADKAVLQVLHQCGAIMSVNETEITVERSKLNAFHFNATDCPDLFPPLAALACYCEGTSVIEGVKRLRHKESDRAKAIVKEFSSLGVEIRLQEDLMIIQPGKMQPARPLHSHHDHRIAMALAIAGIRMEGDIIIEEAGSVNKSYPRFWEDISLAGVTVSLSEQA